jgi:hypothetical protein
MEFRDYTITSGDIQSERRHDTAAMASHAVEAAGEFLGELHAGKTRVRVRVPGLPEFDVMLGIPEAVFGGDRQLRARSAAPGRFFCVAAPGCPPFQYNLVLPAGRISMHQQTIDQRAIATLVGLSTRLGSPENGSGPQRVIQRLWNTRPLLATTFLARDLPVSPASLWLVMVAADFSTCFAAAMLNRHARLAANSA